MVGELRTLYSINTFNFTPKDVSSWRNFGNLLCVTIIYFNIKTINLNYVVGSSMTQIFFFTKYFAIVIFNDLNILNVFKHVKQIILYSAVWPLDWSHVFQLNFQIFKNIFAMWNGNHVGVILGLFVHCMVVLVVPYFVFGNKISQKFGRVPWFANVSSVSLKFFVWNYGSASSKIFCTRGAIVFAL